MVQDNLRQKRLQWFWSCENGNGGRSVEISGRNRSIGEKEIGRRRKLGKI